MKLIAKIISCLMLLLTLSQQVIAETITYVHTDMLGSPIAETDESGNVLWREHYSPFGEKLDNTAQSTGNDVGYTGHQHDRETGLTYMQARYYDPVIGRFYSNDPVGALDHSNIAHGFNRYAYANNNPYAYSDPDGQLPIRKIKPTPLPTPPAPSPMNPPHIPPNTPSGQPPVTLPDVPDILQLPPTAAVIIIGLDIIQNMTKSEENSEYTGHGENPEGQTGKGSSWNKHSGKRAGKKYGAEKNKKRGKKNKKYTKPKNPNQKKQK